MTRTRTRTTLYALVAAGSAFALAACGGSAGSAESSSSAATSASGGEGALVVYSGRDEELVQPLIDRFQTSSGITVQVRYGSTTELAGQLVEEGAASPAHVFLAQDAGALGAVSEAKLFTTLPTATTSKVPAKYTSKDGSWVGLTGRARVIAYDSQKYKEADVPAQVTDLVKPEWKGKVGLAPSNASFQAFVTAMRLKDGEAAAKAWLAGLVANGAKSFESNGDILEAVNSGALDLGLINHYYWARSEADPKTLRAQLKFGAPGSTSALVNVTGAGILSAKAGPQAQQFVDYLLSDAGQAYFVDETYEYPLVGSKGPANVPPLAELDGPDINLSELSSVKETVQLITEAGLL